MESARSSLNLDIGFLSEGNLLGTQTWCILAFAYSIR